MVNNISNYPEAINKKSND